MSGPLEYASTHFPEMLDVPSNHPPASEEDIRMFKEISRELAQRVCQTLAEENSELICEDEDEEGEVNMSGPLKYAATHFPEMVDIPSNHPPMTDEEIQRFEEIARELAELSARSLAERTGDPVCEDEREEKEKKKQRQHCSQTHGGR